MSILFDPTQLALGAAARGAMARQTALATNLANVDTPGYLRKDVDFQGVLQSALDGGDDPRDIAFAAETDTSAPVRVDGNSVDIDAESSALAQNALTYDALTRVASVRTNIIKIAMGVAS
jgi:flagellar basal-body rod protein FlgB